MGIHAGKAATQNSVLSSGKNVASARTWTLTAAYVNLVPTDFAKMLGMTSRLSMRRTMKLGVISLENSG